MARLAKGGISFKDSEFGLDPSTTKDVDLQNYIKHFVTPEFQKYLSLELEKLQEVVNRHLESCKASKFEPNTVFIIMPFTGKGADQVYRVVKGECNNIGLKATRVDEKFGSGLILRDILTLIERAEFIICDLTYQRPNVYYELGYAHGVGNHGSNILLVAKKGTTIHFDIAPLRVQFYDSPEHLRHILQYSIKEMMNTSRNQG